MLKFKRKRIQRMRVFPEDSVSKKIVEEEESKAEMDREEGYHEEALDVMSVEVEERTKTIQPAEGS